MTILMIDCFLSMLLYSISVGVIASKLLCDVEILNKINKVYDQI